jgi:glycosyltransferase involved in cell wall biosynthesis
MPHPLVSVVVPCHNYGRFLGECLESVLIQRCAESDLEIIVVDDGSTDETAAVAGDFARHGVQLITHPANRGLVATLNSGLGAARGKYVARIDADDRYRAGFVQETVSILEREADIGLVYGDVASCDETGRIHEDPYSGIASHQRHDGRDAAGDEFLALMTDYVVPAPTIMMRAALLRGALPIPAWFEWPAPTDWYLTLKIAQQSPVYYRARTLADYRVHPANMHRAPDPCDGRQERTVLRALDELFGAPDRAAQIRVRRRTYAHAYANEADRYFGAGRWPDARRCYWRAAALRPRRALQPAWIRRLVATYIGPPAYSRIKQAWTGIGQIASR